MLGYDFNHKLHRCERGVVMVFFAILLYQEGIGVSRHVLSVKQVERAGKAFVVWELCPPSPDNGLGGLLRRDSPEESLLDARTEGVSAG